jgi:hypothetical protein
VFGWLITAYLTARVESDAHLRQAYARLPAFRMTLAHAAPAPAFSRFEADWGERRYRMDGRQGACAAPLSGEQAVTLLSALRETEGVLLKDPSPCAGTPGAVLHELTFFVPETLPPDSQGELMITAACLDAHPALRAPLEAVARLHRQADC